MFIGLCISAKKRFLVCNVNGIWEQPPLTAVKKRRLRTTREIYNKAPCEGNSTRRYFTLRMAGDNARFASWYFIKTYWPRRHHLRHQRDPASDIHPLFTNIYIDPMRITQCADGAPGSTYVRVGVFSIMCANIPSFHTRMMVVGPNRHASGVAKKSHHILLTIEILRSANHKSLPIPP